MDLATQPYITSTLSLLTELGLGLSGAFKSAILLSHEHNWNVAAYGCETLKTYTVFPALRWHEIEGLQMEQLDATAQSLTVTYDPAHTAYTNQLPIAPHGIKSLYLPISHNGNFMGILYLTFAQRMTISDRCLHLLKLQCTQAALSLYQSHYYYNQSAESSNVSSLSVLPYSNFNGNHPSTIWQNRYEAAGWASGQILYEWNFLNNNPTWGPNTEQILGYLPHEMPTSFDEWSNLIHPQDQEKFRNSVSTCIENRDPLRIEYRILNRDQNYRWVEDRNHVFVDAVSYSLCVVGFIIDIHERKLAEERIQAFHNQILLANVELERATRLKDEFLACMSHELRTPLNSVLGISEILLDEISGSLNQQQRKYLNTISRSGNHLLELINDILDVAKIEAGKLELNVSSVWLQNLCESSFDYVRQSAIAKSIQVCLSIAEGLGKIQVDERRMRQVLINLLSNAIKFTPEQGAIEFSVSLDPNRQLVLMSVKDTGIGIQAEDFDRLFQPFTQIQSQLNRNYSGTGLGLMLAKKIVELHHGQITVESELGKGSCFQIRLPYQPSPDEAFAHAGKLDATMPYSQVLPCQLLQPVKPLILLAEDNSTNVEIFGDYLEAMGYQVIFAFDGQAAIVMAEKYTPDLMLVDIQMPKQDGLEVIRQVRENHDLRHIPIIALTALAMPNDRERCLAIGANEYLAKPVKLKQLVNKVEELLAQNSLS
jgi:PAS domain S-box-containing protein